MSEFKLIKEIIALSVSDNWDSARLEWKLIEILEADEPETCICGHFPIIELCELLNIKNKKTVIVGNHCVKKFLGISSDKIFASVKKIRTDISKAANIETIVFLYDKGLLTDWEKMFYENTLRKRNLSEAQLQKRIQVNRKILGLVKKHGIK
jgi:hypothetical protein